MKTTVITLISLLFMIPLSYAGNDGERAVNTDKVTLSVMSNDNAGPTAELIVIDLNDAKPEHGLPLDIRNQLDEVLTYPKNVNPLHSKECVLIEYTYDDEGYIHVESSKTSNVDIRDHVIKNIEKIRLRNGSVTIGKPYYAKFSFERL